jgi:hypothetical protein
MATPLLIALGALGAGLGGRFAMQRLAARGGKTGMDAWVKGGFQTKMDPKEAKQILGIRSVGLIARGSAGCSHRSRQGCRHPSADGQPAARLEVEVATVPGGLPG